MHEEESLPIFGPVSGLPVGTPFPNLLDAFLKYCGDNFCYLNRKGWNGLLSVDKRPSFPSL